MLPITRYGNRALSRTRTASASTATMRAGSGRVFAGSLMLRWQGSPQRGFLPMGAGISRRKTRRIDMPRRPQGIPAEDLSDRDLKRELIHMYKTRADTFFDGSAD